LRRDEANPDDDREQAEDALQRGRLAQKKESADRGQHRPGAACDRIDHREIGDLIASLQAETVGEVNGGAEEEAGEGRQAPRQIAVGEKPDHPRQIDEASKQIIGEDEGGAGIGGALGE
jgi:hypothetical protein